MRIELAPGEELTVGFKDTDGEFSIGFDGSTPTWAIRVKADLPDSSGRSGIIYEEIGGGLDEKPPLPGTLLPGVVMWENAPHKANTSARIADICDRAGKLHRLYVRRLAAGRQSFVASIDGDMLEGSWTQIDAATKAVEEEFRRRYWNSGKAA